MGDLPDHAHPDEDSAASHLRYSSIKDFFLQADPATDPTGFDYVSSNMGLIERSYPTDDSFDPHRQKSQWQRFEFYVKHLNANNPKGTSTKLLYLARHGQGFHNVAESFYGTHDWDCYWSKQEGNDTVTWADARLTATGEGQARTANEFFRAKIAEGLPTPQSWYVSPLERCLRTAQLTWADLPFAPLVKERLREALGVHTCDRRSPRAYIRAAYPSFHIEPGFAEDDPLWDPDVRESDDAMDVRLTELLDDVFSSDDAAFVSFTSHSGAIGSLLRALGHRRFDLQTGGIIPVLVRAERVPGPAPTKSIAPGVPAPTCTVEHETSKI